MVEDLLFERGIEICHKTVELWWNRLGPRFAASALNSTRKRYQAGHVAYLEEPDAQRGLRGTELAMSQVGDARLDHRPRGGPS